jgi:hypothetical protein
MDLEAALAGTMLAGAGFRVPPRPRNAEPAPPHYIHWSCCYYWMPDCY